VKALLVVAVAACASRPAEPLAHVGTQTTPAKPHYRNVASAPRPDVDVSAYLPDLHEELRWPLTVQTHPMLEPHFPIARELAQPGVGWEQLCTPAVLGRHVAGANASDVMEYLRGWCVAVNGDADGALDHFARVRGSVVSGLAAALVYDVPFVLCEQTADVAERLLDKHTWNDVALLDVLAATYVEIGRDDDARVINQRAIAFARGRTSDAAFCHRGARAVLLGGRLDVLEAEKAKSKDGTCVELIDALACLVKRDCLAYWNEQGHDTREIALWQLYVDWPTTTVSSRRWMDFVELAEDARPLADAETWGHAALIEAIKASTCSKTELEVFRIHAAAVAKEYAAMTYTDCRNLQLTTGD